jgi:hypothetical protein
MRVQTLMTLTFPRRKARITRAFLVSPIITKQSHGALLCLASVAICKYLGVKVRINVLYNMRLHNTRLLTGA